MQCNVLVSMRLSNANEDGLRMSTGAIILALVKILMIAAEPWYWPRIFLIDWRRVAISSGVLKPRGPAKRCISGRAVRAWADGKTLEISPLPAPGNR